jgi:metal-responsive CopG/Arc/MetJ family transcriptional regulator
MRRTTIVAPEDLLAQLRRVAAERNTSMATLIREALEEKVKSHRPKPRSLGIGDSGRSDISRRTAEEPAIPEPWR